MFQLTMDKAVIILLAMIFCHIHDDFVRQGILASFKQKKYWEENYPDKMYENDWLISLIIHATKWSISIHIPIIVVYYIMGVTMWPIIISCIIAAILHSWVDHMKANRLSINLVYDQMSHLLQILMVWVFLILSFFL